MRLRIKVKPGVKRAFLRVLGGNEFEIGVTEKPANGRANEAVLRALGGHLGVAASRLRLVSGGRGRIKFFEIK